MKRQFAQRTSRRAAAEERDARLAPSAPSRAARVVHAGLRTPLSAAQVLHLQRTIGNRAVGDLLARRAGISVGARPAATGAAPERSVQRVKELDSGAKVLESKDTEEKRQFFQKHINTLIEKKLFESALKLQNQMKMYPELQEDEVIYTSVRGEQQPSVTYALFAHTETGPYYIFPTSYGAQTDQIDAQVADGAFQFVVTVERPNEVLVGTGGHDSLAKHGNVWYAGTVYFSGGTLDRWNNDTGHYRTIPEHAKQALRVPNDTFSNSLLPGNKFQEFEGH